MLKILKIFTVNHSSQEVCIGGVDYDLRIAFKIYRNLYVHMSEKTKCFEG